MNDIFPTSHSLTEIALIHIFSSLTFHYLKKRIFSKTGVFFYSKIDLILFNQAR